MDKRRTFCKPFGQSNVLTPNVNVDMTTSVDKSLVQFFQIVTLTTQKQLPATSKYMMVIA